MSMLTFAEPVRAPANPPSEIARVQQHLLRAEQRARAERTLQLSQQQRLVRALLLDELAHYRQRGQFPHNRDSADSAPHFVDHAGTRCALAHLLDVAGERTLVQRIAAERNHARVRELADEPRLRAWLCAAGLTLAEAAAIQPEYCRSSAAAVCTDHRGDPWSGSTRPTADAVLEGTVSSVASGSFGLSTVQIVAIHGPASPSYQVGQSAEVWIDRGDGVVAPGATVLIPVQSVPAEGGIGLSGILLSERSTYRSSSELRESNVPALGAQQYIDVMRSPDCFAALDAIDSRWTRRKCTNDDGCATSPGYEGRAPTTLGILLVLVATLAARSRSTRS